MLVVWLGKKLAFVTFVHKKCNTVVGLNVASHCGTRGTQCRARRERELLPREENVFIFAAATGRIDDVSDHI